MKQVRNLIFVFACLSFLASCQTMFKVAKVIMDPSIKVGDNSDQATEVTFNSIASNNVNSSGNGQAAPIVLHFYALSSDHKFYGYDMYSLTAQPDESLGATLVEVIDEVSLDPGQYDIHGSYKIPEKTRYIGVIAEFADYDNAVWRTVVPVKPTGSEVNVVLTVGKNSLTVNIKD